MTKENIEDLDKKYGDINIVFKIIDDTKTIKTEKVKYSKIRGYEKDNMGYYVYKPYNKKYEFDNMVLNGNNNEKLLIEIDNNPEDIHKDKLVEEFILETDPQIDDYDDRFVKTFDLEKGKTDKIIEVTPPHSYEIKLILLNVISLWSEMDDRKMTKHNEEQMKYNERLWNTMSKILKCKVTFDASESYANCYHKISKFIWDFGDGSKIIETREPKKTHYYSFGKYKFKMKAEAWCGTVNGPNSALFEEEIHIGIKNLRTEKIIECPVIIIVKDPEYIGNYRHAIIQYMDIEKEELLV